MTIGLVRGLNNGTVASGDISGTLPGPIKVVGIQGNPVINQTLGSAQDGYYAQWVNSAGLIEWNPIPAFPTYLTMGGDVIGTTNANTLYSIDGSVLPTPVGATGILQTTAGTLSWSPVNLADTTYSVTGVLATGNQADQSLTLTGDVNSSGGTTGGASTTVVALQGFPVASGSPPNSYVLTSNGFEWYPAPSSGGGSSPTGPAGGDLTGYYPNPQVQEISGFGGAPIFKGDATNLIVDNTNGVAGLDIGNSFLNWYVNAPEGYNIYGSWLESYSGYDASQIRIPACGVYGIGIEASPAGTFMQVAYSGYYSSPPISPVGQIRLESTFSNASLGYTQPTASCNIASSLSLPNQVYTNTNYTVNSGTGNTYNACVFNPFSNSVDFGTYNTTLITFDPPEFPASSDHVICADCSGGAISIQLIDPTDSGVGYPIASPTFIISDITGNAATNNITILNPDSSTLTTINVNFGSVTVLWHSNSTSVDSYGRFDTGLYIVISRGNP